MPSRGELLSGTANAGLPLAAKPIIADLTAARGSRRAEIAAIPRYLGRTQAFGSPSMIGSEAASELAVSGGRAEGSGAARGSPPSPRVSRRRFWPTPTPRHRRGAAAGTAIGGEVASELTAWPRGIGSSAGNSENAFDSPATGRRMTVRQMRARTQRESRRTCSRFNRRTRLQGIASLLRHLPLHFDICRFTG